MKKILSLTLTVLLLAGCAHKTITETANTYADGSPKTVRVYEKTNGDTVLKSEKNYYKTGELKMEGNYENNKRNGKWISYYRNGNVWAEATYRNGKEQGTKTVYYTGEMKDGKRIGKWRFTDVDGNTSTIDYDKRND